MTDFDNDQPPESRLNDIKMLILSVVDSEYLDAADRDRLAYAIDLLEQENDS